MNKLKYIDVSGVGNSGKSALVDLLREYENDTWAPHFQFEFDLLRAPGGIFDLKYSLVDNWSQIRSNYAYKRFVKVASKMGGNGKCKSLLDLSLNYGTSYQIFFNYMFHKHTKDFVESLLVCKYKAFWPYDMLDDNPFVRFFKKVYLKFKIQKKLLSNVYLVGSDQFNELAHKYIDNLFKEVDPNISNKAVILNNSFEPFNPEVGLNILSGSRSIIVVRDPRDIFVSGKNIFNMKYQDKKLMASDNDGINKSFLGADDLECFIDRMNLYLDKITYNDERVFIVKFEDLVMNYEATKLKLEVFLNLKADDHISPLTQFDPKKSRRNIGAWKNYSNQQELQFIKEKMSRHEWIFQN